MHAKLSCYINVYSCTVEENRSKPVTEAIRKVGERLAGGFMSDVDIDIGGGIALVGASILALPFALAGLVIVLPALIPLGIFASFTKLQDYKEEREYLKSKALYMEKWTTAHVKKLFTPENVNALVFESYFKYFENQILEICDKKIPAIIESDEDHIQNILRDNRAAREILQDFQPLQRSLDNVSGKLRIFFMRHLDKDRNYTILDSFTIGKEIVVGKTFTVYRVVLHPHDVTDTEDTSKAAKRSNKSDLFESLNEVECLRYVINIK